MNGFVAAIVRTGAGAPADVIPLASVIIVNYNGRSYLPACLDSLFDSAEVGLEIIVVDNASTDDSVDLVTDAYPQVRLIRSRENLGFGGANNLAAAQAQGAYLAFLNPDTVVTPGWLAALMATLEADPQAGLATSQILLLDQPDRVNTCGNEMHLSGLTLCRGMGQTPDRFTTVAEVGAVSGAAFAMRRDLFLTLGGFDADFFMYFEDTDLSWRARLAGYRCLYVPGSVVYHDYTLRFGPNKTYYQERNRYRALLKLFHWPTLLLLLPALLLTELLTWGFVLLNDRPHWPNKLRAYGDIIRHWPILMMTRRQTQAGRRVGDRHLLRQTTYRLAFEQTGDTWVTHLAHIFFAPLFYIWRRVLLGVIRW